MHHNEKDGTTNCHSNLRHSKRSLVTNVQIHHVNLVESLVYPLLWKVIRGPIKIAHREILATKGSKIPESVPNRQIPLWTVLARHFDQECEESRFNSSSFKLPIIFINKKRHRQALNKIGVKFGPNYFSLSLAKKKVVLVIAVWFVCEISWRLWSRQWLTESTSCRHGS